MRTRPDAQWTWPAAIWLHLSARSSSASRPWTRPAPAGGRGASDVTRRRPRRGGRHRRARATPDRRGPCRPPARLRARGSASVRGRHGALVGGYPRASRANRTGPARHSEPGAGARRAPESGATGAGHARRRGRHHKGDARAAGFRLHSVVGLVLCHGGAGRDWSTAPATASNCRAPAWSRAACWAPRASRRPGRRTPTGGGRPASPHAGRRDGARTSGAHRRVRPTRGAGGAGPDHPLNVLWRCPAAEHERRVSAAR